MSSPSSLASMSGALAFAGSASLLRIFPVGSRLICRTRKSARIVLELTEDNIGACLAYAAEREQRVLTQNKHETLVRSEPEFQTLPAGWRHFPDSKQVGLAGLDGPNDTEIWNYAATNGLTVVKRDADFSRYGSIDWSTAQDHFARLGE